jgi:hypothetical protein
MPELSADDEGCFVREDDSGTRNTLRMSGSSVLVSIGHSHLQWNYLRNRARKRTRHKFRASCVFGGVLEPRSLRRRFSTPLPTADSLTAVVLHVLMSCTEQAAFPRMLPQHDLGLYCHIFIFARS